MIVTENYSIVRAEGISNPLTREPLVHSYSPDNNTDEVVIHIVSYLPGPLDPSKKPNATVATELENLNTEAGSLSTRLITLVVDYDLQVPHSYNLVEFFIKYELNGDPKAQAIYVKEHVHEFIEDHDPETTRGTVTTPKII